VDTLDTSPAEPLTRRTLLRGTGYNTLFVELTSRCNERCVHCYADAGPEQSTELPWAAVEGVLEDARRLGFERGQLTGGDPLIASTLTPAVARARELGIPQLEIYTNGLALTEPLLNSLHELGPQLAFSVYAAAPAIHDDITRTPGSHARTLRAIRACLGLGLSVRVGATLLAHTLNQRGPLERLLGELGLASEQISFVTSHGVGRGSFVGGQSDKHPGGSLGAGKAAVLADGSIVPCVFARGSVLGSVHSARLYDVLVADVPVSSPQDLDAALDRVSQQLTCGECRMRAVFLGAGRQEGPLVQLRRRP
jgi:pyruvate-formate lyase-activating enzyme